MMIKEDYSEDFKNGSCNMCVVVRFEDDYKALLRFPMLGRSMLRKEKLIDEIYILEYLRQRAPSIPVPKLLGEGDWGGGPYIMTEYVEGVLLSHPLRDTNILSPSIRADVSDRELGRAYRAMTEILLDLYQVSLIRIGSIGPFSGHKRVQKRPITLTVNELVRVGNFPPQELTTSSFETGSEYFQELARLQFLHLKYQRNNAVKDEKDCRKKYLARCLFRRITKEISTQPAPFRLYCDDFRPSNVLVASESDFTIKAVIDWEYTYSAPVEFSHAAPWWLLFESPESWESDLTKFLDRYKPRLQLFLQEMK